MELDVEIACSLSEEYSGSGRLEKPRFFGAAASCNLLLFLARKICVEPGA